MFNLRKKKGEREEVPMEANFDQSEEEEEEGGVTYCAKRRGGGGRESGSAERRSGKEKREQYERENWLLDLFLPPPLFLLLLLPSLLSLLRQPNPPLSLRLLSSTGQGMKNILLEKFPPSSPPTMHNLSADSLRRFFCSFFLFMTEIKCFFPVSDKKGGKKEGRRRRGEQWRRRPLPFKSDPPPLPSRLLVRQNWRGEEGSSGGNPRFEPVWTPPQKKVSAECRMPIHFGSGRSVATWLIGGFRIRPREGKGDCSLGVGNGEQQTSDVWKSFSPSSPLVRRKGGETGRDAFKGTMGRKGFRNPPFEPSLSWWKFLPPIPHLSGETVQAALKQIEPLPLLLLRSSLSLYSVYSSHFFRRCEWDPTSSLSSSLGSRFIRGRGIRQVATGVI